MTAPLAEAIRVLSESSGVPVSGKVPNPRPPQFLRVVRAGGARTRSVDHMLLVVECWAPTSVEAEVLAYRVDNILREAPDRSNVIAQWGDNDRGASIADNPDPDTDQARWTVTATLHCI